ncbi:hypothetical protein EFP84_18865 [Leptospira kmetyi]|uniref:Uncharacterized protein n=1 Tax=Leptospira kmetyi TaxID=408139 RepID=A0AAD0UWY2_9LEPT|nr:hypothetical protein [Leptospira kmetyi]AYV57702.1 hypothetical protein EFP84_18865 [Leptospira kmetyi]
MNDENFLKDLPKEYLNKIKFLNEKNRSQISQRSVEAISNHKDYAKIEAIIDFTNHLLFKSAKGDIKTVIEIGTIPILQAQHDFILCLENIIFCNYRNAIDSLRRSYEMCILQIYFLSESLSLDDIKKWQNGKRNAPYFSVMLKSIFKKAYFAEFDSNFDLKQKIEELYWELSDIVHVKGAKKIFLNYEKTLTNVSYISIKDFNPILLNKIIQDLILVFENIICLFILNNHVILKGYPLFEKFGLNEPFSGIFNERESEIVWSLIPDQYKDHFENIVTHSEEVKSIDDWIYNLKDLTEEEIQSQFDELNS